MLEMFVINPPEDGIHKNPRRPTRRRAAGAMPTFLTRHGMPATMNPARRKVRRGGVKARIATRSRRRITAIRGKDAAIARRLGWGHRLKRAGKIRSTWQYLVAGGRRKARKTGLGSISALDYLYWRRRHPVSKKRLRLRRYRKGVGYPVRYRRIGRARVALNPKGRPRTRYGVSHRKFMKTALKKAYRRGMSPRAAFRKAVAAWRRARGRYGRRIAANVGQVIPLPVAWPNESNPRRRGHGRRRYYRRNPMELFDNARRRRTRKYRRNEPRRRASRARRSYRKNPLYPLPIELNPKHYDNPAVAVLGGIEGTFKKITDFNWVAQNLLPLGGGFFGSRFVSGVGTRLLGVERTGIVKILADGLAAGLVTGASMVFGDHVVTNRVLEGGLLSVLFSVLEEILPGEVKSAVGLSGVGEDDLEATLKARISEAIRREMQGGRTGVSDYLNTEALRNAPRMGMADYLTREQLETQAPVMAQHGRAPYSVQQWPSVAPAATVEQLSGGTGSMVANMDTYSSFADSSLV